MRIPALLVVLAVMAASCGGDEEAASTTSPSSSTTTTTTTTSTTTTLPSTTSTGEATTSTATPPSTLPPSKPFVTTIGLGGVIVGMTVEEAEEASGYELVGKLDPDVSEDCYFVEPTEASSGLTGVLYMVYKDEIARVDIVSPSPTTTRSGAGVGLDADLLQELFPGQIEEAPQFTVDGLALMYVPRDEADADYRIIFDIEDGRVAAYRSGILPAVGFGEGCL